MNEGKIIELFHDRFFIAKFNGMQTKEDIIELLNENGAKIEFDDLDDLHRLFDRYVNGRNDIPDEYLEDISAGISVFKDNDIKISEIQACLDKNNEKN